MKLPFSLKFNKKKPEFFLVLVLRDEKVAAVIFEEQIGKAKVVGQHEEYLQNSIDSISLEEFLDILDRTISKAESSLPEGFEPQKTIFGVKENWIENDKIKKEHLLKLKKVCDELGLTPIGFLIISQAISYLLQKEEGAPLSAILVDVGKTSTEVSLIRNGKVIETKVKAIEDNIPHTVDRTLEEFASSETLPSRIIIFDEQKDLNQEFIAHQWSKRSRFLHLPQITTLESDFAARAVLFGVATQMGFEVLEDIKKTKDSKEQPPEEFENLSMEHFGFVRDTDIKSAPVAVSTTMSIASTNADVQEKITSETVETSSAVTKAPVKKEVFLSVTKSATDVVKEVLTKASRFLPSFSFPINIINKKAIFIPALVVILLIGFYFFGAKATVFLDIKPEIIKEENNITFSATSIEDGKNGIVVAGKSISVSLEGEASTPTSGKKEVGTKAKGTITLFNNTDSSKTFSKGTTITSSNNLKFLIEDNVTVASASGDVFSGTTPGKSNVDVIASAIGGEFNLPSNTKFSIGDNPSIAAKNDDPFSGGTKKEVAVVSKNDIDKLLDELQKKLQKNTEEELIKQVLEDEVMLPIILAVSIVKKNFDKDINDEADHLTLKGTIVYKALSYNKKNLISQIASSLKTNVSDNKILDEENIKIDIKDAKKKNEEEVNAIISMEAVLKPKIDEKKLIGTIAGMSYKDAREKLMSLTQATNVRISPTLDIPLLPKTLPRVSQNIKIIVDLQ